MTAAARIAVAPHKYFQGSDGTDRVVPWAYEVLDLRAALERVYDSDAHCVTYTIPGARFQPRINKAGLPDIPSFVGVGVFFCDVDLPNHGDWTPDLLAEAEKQYATLDVRDPCRRPPPCRRRGNHRRPGSTWGHGPGGCGKNPLRKIYS